MGQNSIVPSTDGKKTFRYGTTKKTDVEKRTKRTLDERTTKSGRSDARVDYVIAENRKTFETRKFGNTRNGPRTRPPSDPVSFRRNLGVFRKRSDPCRFPPLTRHALPSRVGPSDPMRAAGTIPGLVSVDFRPMFIRNGRLPPHSGDNGSTPAECRSRTRPLGFPRGSRRRRGQHKQRPGIPTRVQWNSAGRP